MCVGITFAAEARHLSKTMAAQSTSRIWKRTMCPSKARVDGKVVIITGANGGIGKETARDLVARGARVILACRDVAKANEAADDIKNADSNEDSVLVKQLDLADLSSVRKFATEVLEKEPKIDILINNAGVMITPDWKTKDGFEMQLGVNHLGHHLLTNLLLERIKASAPSRIITVSSVAHKYGKIHFDDLQFERNYKPRDAYSQSKLANVLFTRELAKRLKGTGVSTYALHPGVITTDLWRHSGNTMSSAVPWFMNKIGKYFMKNPVEGAQTTIYCAVAEELAGQTGLYYSDCAVKEPSSRAKNDEHAQMLWDISCGLVGLK